MATTTNLTGGKTPKFVREPDLVDLIVDGIELSLPVSVAVEAVGIKTGTWKAWMLRGRRDEADGLHGGDECDECQRKAAKGNPYKRGCAAFSPYVLLRDEVLRARSAGFEALAREAREKALSEKGGSRVLLELMRSLYPDKFHGGAGTKRGKKYVEHELLGFEPDELRDEAEELELEKMAAEVERTQAQTELIRAQREQVGRSGSYFDKLIVAVAGAVAGATEGGITQQELEAASPSAQLDGELEAPSPSVAELKRRVTELAKA